MEKGLLDSVMTGHSVYEDIDPENPATLSKKVIDLIRDKGFDGIVWTDSLAMMAILQKYGEENIQGLAIAAGNDIVLPNYRTPVEVSWGHLLQNYADGMITPERLEEAVRRVLKLMNDLAKIPEPVDVFTEEDQKLYDSIARESVTAVCDEGVSPALDPSKSKLFVVMTPNTFKADEEELFETTTAKWYFPQRVAEKIRKEYPDAAIEFIPEYGSSKDNERVLVASTKYDETIYVTYCETVAYLGTDCMTRRAESVINSLALAGKLAAIVHFGNPFALEPLYHIPRKIFGYTMPDSQLYAIDVLKGNCAANGNLPFDVKFQ
jgi:beta-glucosidase-like glycosyl hydrolase